MLLKVNRQSVTGPAVLDTLVRIRESYTDVDSDEEKAVGRFLRAAREGRGLRGQVGHLRLRLWP